MVDFPLDLDMQQHIYGSNNAAVSVAKAQTAGDSGAGTELLGGLRIKTNRGDGDGGADGSACGAGDDAGDDADRWADCRYELFAVTNHSGSMTCGHYTAYGMDPRSRDWYYFSDSVVRKLSSPSEAITKNAYVLYYRRVM
jgi:hypothetical protein